MEKTIKILDKIAKISLILFIIELIFGYTGQMIIIAGKDIRILILLLNIIIWSGYCVVFLISRYLKKFNPITETIKKITKMDFAFLLFYILLIIFATIVPLMKGTNLLFARYESIGTILTLSLYFPIRVLNLYKQIDLKVYKKYIVAMLFIVSLSNIILYMGQSKNSLFIWDYFDFLDKLLLGPSIAPPIILGEGYVRIIFVNSTNALVGIYFAFKNLKKITLFDYIAIATHIIAIIATFLRGMWASVAFAFVIFIIGCIIHLIKTKSKKMLMKTVAITIYMIAVVLVSNALIFDNTLMNRMGMDFSENDITTVEPDNSTETPNFGNEEPDIDIRPDGDEEVPPTEKNEPLPENSNSTKLDQSIHLIKKWKTSPLVGYGFGSYVEDCIRSEINPFSYEMQFPALLMKTGIVGVGMLVILLVLIVVNCMQKTNSIIEVSAWLFLFISIGGSVQTNPFLLTITGMSQVMLLMFCTESSTKVE